MRRAAWATGLGEGRGSSATGSTLRFGRAGARTAVSICSPRIIRVELEVEGQVAGPSHLDAQAWAATRFEAIEGDPLRLTTADLTIEVAPDPVRLAFLDSTGARLLHEPIDGGMSAERLRDGSSRRVRACFAFSGEQHFYGLGQGGGASTGSAPPASCGTRRSATGPGSDMGLPLLLSNRGYGLFFDNTSDAALAVGRSDNGVRIVYTAEAGRLTWYFLMGRDLRSVMGEVAELLGRAIAPAAMGARLHPVHPPLR